MRSVSFFAIVTLIILDDEFNNNSLLNGCSSINLFLHCDLNLQSLGMGFRPKEGGVDQLHSLKPFHLLKAKREQFWGLQLEMDPWRSQIPVTFPAMLKINLSCDSLCDIDFGFEAVHASGLALDCNKQNTAHAASDLVSLNESCINIHVI